MLTTLQIKNFKCFQQAELTLASLTLLSGLNSTGKSSVLQSLLLLRQSYKEGGKIRLNGDLIELGQALDVFAIDAKNDEMEFQLSSSDWDTVTWANHFDVSKDLFTSTTALKDIEQLALFNDNFHYISADRWGPRVSVPLSDFDVHHNNLGKYGEYSIHYLLEQGDRHLKNSNIGLLNEDAGTTLLPQVQAWLNDISPGVKIDPKEFKTVNAGTIGFSFPSEVGFSRPFRPTHVGFGLSYTLPVIVALLSLPKNGLIILENPEAHLHPRGQSLMGKLIAHVAAAGTQVIVETHSDHLLNGIRIAVRDGLLTPEQTVLHYFSRNGSAIEITTPQIDSDGKIDKWPEGFFDESIRNLAALSSRRRERNPSKT
ncbi:AAA family ATPase [Methylovulum miyakonense]|uniref:AAA family ATPase n=1 Tax=Methylovulum miyakonense TaxID=645578 RepID=UPI00035C4EDE|nr:DUF3696 domain-containing protein [Methylovulum miyakonense]